MAYFIAFTISVGTCFFGEKIIKARLKKWVAYLFFAISILTLIVLAGCRDYTIGTDIGYYGDWVFKAARRADDFGKFITTYIGIIEPFYLTLNFLVSRFTEVAHWLYAAIGTVIYVCFFVGLYRFRREISITYGWTVFLLLFYVLSYNLMRQMLAMSIIFMGSIHILNNRYKRFLPYAIAAALFHQTAIVFSVAVVGMRILIPRRNKRVYQLMVILGAFALMFGYNYILQMLLNFGILSAKYAMYISNIKFNIALNPIIQRITPIILFLLFSKKRYEGEGEIRSFFVSMMILDLILVMMGSMVNATLVRVTYYCALFNILAYPFFLRRIPSVFNKNVVGAFLIIALTGIWIYQIVYRGNNEVWPYTSEILGIR